MRWRDLQKIQIFKFDILINLKRTWNINTVLPFTLVMVLYGILYAICQKKKAIGIVIFAFLLRCFLAFLERDPVCRHLTAPVLKR